MLFCHILIGSFAHKRIGQLGKYFPRYITGSEIKIEIKHILLNNTSKGLDTSYYNIR